MSNWRATNDIRKDICIPTRQRRNVSVIILPNVFFFLLFTTFSWSLERKVAFWSVNVAWNKWRCGSSARLACMAPADSNQSSMLRNHCAAVHTTHSSLKTHRGELTTSFCSFLPLSSSCWCIRRTVKSHEMSRGWMPMYVEMVKCYALRVTILVPPWLPL